MGGSACQQSAPSVNTNTSEGKGSISSLSVHDLCSSIKPLTRTGSYHVHSHRHRPHYLLFFSMKVKCLLYQNIHLKQNAFPYQPLQMLLWGSSNCVQKHWSLSTQVPLFLLIYWCLYCGRTFSVPGRTPVIYFACVSPVYILQWGKI